MPINTNSAPAPPGTPESPLCRLLVRLPLDGGASVRRPLGPPREKMGDLDSLLQDFSYLKSLEHKNQAPRRMSAKLRLPDPTYVVIVHCGVNGRVGGVVRCSAQRDHHSCLPSPASVHYAIRKIFETSGELTFDRIYHRPLGRRGPDTRWGGLVNALTHTLSCCRALLSGGVYSARRG